MKRNAKPKPEPKPENVVLTAEDAAKEFRLDLEDAEVLVGSGVRVPWKWLEGYRSRLGQLDFSLADCSLLIGVSLSALRQWRVRGILKVRTTSIDRSEALLVPPAELVRVLRKIAADRNSMTSLPESPSQERRRIAAAVAAARAACEGR